MVKHFKPVPLCPPQMTEQTLSGRMQAIQELSEAGDNFLQLAALTEEDLIVVQDKSDHLTQGWNSLLLEVAEKQLLLGNVIRCAQDVMQCAERLRLVASSGGEPSSSGTRVRTSSLK